MTIDEVIEQRLNAMENDLKQALECLFDVYNQKGLIECLCS